MSHAGDAVTQQKKGRFCGLFFRRIFPFLLALSLALSCSELNLLKELADNSKSKQTSPSASSGAVRVSSAPSVSSVRISSAAFKSVGLNADIDFTVGFSQIVTVVENPLLSFSIGTEERRAYYQRGNGSRELVFSYKVGPRDHGIIQVKAIHSLILEMGDGRRARIQDAQGNGASLTLLPALGGSVNTSVPSVPNGGSASNGGSSSAPRVTAVSIFQNKDYGSSEPIYFFVDFSDPVTVTGSPRLSFSIGDEERSALYVSAIDDRQLSFNYDVVDGDNGVIRTTSSHSIKLDLAEGKRASIQDAAGNGANLSLVPFSGGRARTVAPPRVSSLRIQLEADATGRRYIEFSVNFSEPVEVSDRPSLSFSIGGSERIARYRGGSDTSELAFTYEVSADDNGLIQTTSSDKLILNTSGGRTDRIRGLGFKGKEASLTLPPTSGGQVSPSAPPVPIVPNVPNTPIGPNRGPSMSNIDISPRAFTSVGLNGHVDFSVSFSEQVTVTGVPSLPFTLSGNDRRAPYLSGSGSNVLLFRYSVEANDNGKIETNSRASLIFDAAGGLPVSIQGDQGKHANLTLLTSAGGDVDARAPEVTKVSISSAQGTLGPGAVIDFSVSFSEVVTVTGQPSLSFAIGSDDGRKSALYRSGTNSRTLLFRYTVVAGELGKVQISNSYDRLVFDASENSQVSIQDLQGNRADRSLPETVNSTFNVDAVGPSVIDVDMSSNAVRFPADIDLSVEFDEEVRVTGAPSLSFSIGFRDREAVYQSGDSSNTLVFRYTLTREDSGLIKTTTQHKISFNSPHASIKDALGNNSARLALWEQSGGTVWNTRPSIKGVIITPPAHESVRLGTPIDITVSFDKLLRLGNPGVLSLPFSIGASPRAAVYQRQSGLDLIFRYTVVQGDEGDIVIAAGDSLAIGPSGTITDQAGGPADLTLLAAQGGQVDTIGPRVTKLVIAPTFTDLKPTNANFAISEPLFFAVQFNRGVTAKGLPILPIRIGGQLRNAVYHNTNTIEISMSRGADASVLFFTYQTKPGDVGAVTVDAGASLVLPGGASIGSLFSGVAANLPLPNSMGSARVIPAG